MDEKMKILKEEIEEKVNGKFEEMNNVGELKSSHPSQSDGSPRGRATMMATIRTLPEGQQEEKMKFSEELLVSGPSMSLRKDLEKINEVIGEMRKLSEGEEGSPLTKHLKSKMIELIGEMDENLKNELERNKIDEIKSEWMNEKVEEISTMEKKESEVEKNVRNEDGRNVVKRMRRKRERMIVDEEKEREKRIELKESEKMNNEKENEKRKEKENVKGRRGRFREKRFIWRKKEVNEREKERGTSLKNRSKCESV